MLLKDRIKLFIIHKIYLKFFRIFDPNNLILQGEKKLEKDAFTFWNKFKNHDSQKEKSLSHHLGVRNWEKKKFIQYGLKHYEMFEKALVFSNWGKKSTKAKDLGKLSINIVDWGPGGGANMLTFANKIKGRYFGVDIVEKNLEECQKLAGSFKINNFRGVLINISRPEEVYKTIKQCGLFICTAVFPHLPHKKYAERITKIASKLLIKGGIGIIHVLLKDKKKFFYFGKYSATVQSNTVFTYEEYIQILKKYDLELLYVTRDDVETYSYFHVYKR